MADSVKDILVDRQILAFIRRQMKLETLDFSEENSRAINLVNDPMGSARLKHIDIRYHFFLGVFEGDIWIVYVETKLQYADLLAKNLDGEAFRKAPGIWDELDFELLKIFLVVKKQGGSQSLMTYLWYFLVPRGCFWKFFSD